MAIARSTFKPSKNKKVVIFYDSETKKREIYTFHLLHKDVETPFSTVLKTFKDHKLIVMAVALTEETWGNIVKILYCHTTNNEDMINKPFTLTINFD